jgi:formate/nitrite transporter FocA (FNT family)
VESIGSLLRLWGLIYVSNLAGCALFAKLIAIIGPGLGVIEPWTLGQLARTLTAHDGWVILISAILAGWMMGLLSWLVTAGRDTISQIVLVALITGAIGICHLHHSIVGTTEVLAAVFAHQGVTMRQFGTFLLFASLGNGIGGVVFVALIKYGHVMIGTKDAEHVELDNSPKS